MWCIIADRARSTGLRRMAIRRTSGIDAVDAIGHDLGPLGPHEVAGGALADVRLAVPAHEVAAVAVEPVSFPPVLVVEEAGLAGGGEDLGVGVEVGAQPPGGALLGADDEERGQGPGLRHLLVDGPLPVGGRLG